MKYLLDTDVCIGLMRGTAPKTENRIRALPADDVLLRSIVRLELSFGVEVCSRPAQESARVESLWAQFESLAFDDECGDQAAKIRAYLEKRGIKIDAYDSLIAAIARAHELTLLSRNVLEFNRVPGLIVEDWEA